MRGQGVRSLVSYEGRTCQELVDDFHIAVDDYLALCEADGSEPENRIVCVSRLAIYQGVLYN